MRKKLMHIVYTPRRNESASLLNCGNENYTWTQGETDGETRPT